MILAPACAHLFAAMVQPFGSVLERGPRTVYGVEDATVVALRWLPDPPRNRIAVVKQELWIGRANYGLALVAALILATPVWSLGQRFRRLALALGLLVMTELAFFLVTLQSSQAHPVRTQLGTVLPPGFSTTRQAVWGAFYSFFQVMGRGLFPLLVYWGILAWTWGRLDADGAARLRSTGVIRRNDPCPCGSGVKYKRCCGA